MSSTERLRALLDESGVEWYESVTRPGLTWVYRNGKAIRFHAWQPDTLKVSMFDLAPEQAIAATLGAGTCHNANVGGHFVCSECEALVQLHSIGRSYVDEWGKRWYATSNEHSLRFCPNCGRRIVEVDE